MDSRHDDAVRVLSAAVMHAALRLNISTTLLAQVLGADLETVEGMSAERAYLSTESGEWRQAQLFVRMFNALLVLVNDDQLAREWLSARNRELKGRPINLILQGGLDEVVRYLEGVRFGG